MKKPEGYHKEHTNYLDNLRDSGVINMLGARPYLQEDFDLTRNQAKEYLMYWMKGGK